MRTAIATMVFVLSCTTAWAGWQYTPDKGYVCGLFTLEEVINSDACQEGEPSDTYIDCSYAEIDTSDRPRCTNYLTEGQMLGCNREDSLETLSACKKADADGESLLRTKFATCVSKFHHARYQTVHRYVCVDNKSSPVIWVDQAIKWLKNH